MSVSTRADLSSSVVCKQRSGASQIDLHATMHSGWGGRAVECAGLENRKPAAENTDGADVSEDQPNRIVQILAKHPDLAEVVDCWPLLDKRIRSAITALVSVKPKESRDII